VAIAWSSRRGYAARVSRLHFQRWAAIFLLVSNLILGQFAHAMPHMAEPAMAMSEVVASASASASASATDDSPPCGSHVQAGSELGQSQDSNTDDHAAKSCCKGGECACPCLHTPGATAAVPFAMQFAHDGQVAVLVKGAAWQRLSALFRPPAY
jgi:hypothetical protein